MRRNGASGGGLHEGNVGNVRSKRRRRRQRFAAHRGARCRLRILIGCRLRETPEGRRVASIRAVAAAAGVHRNTVAAVFRDLERFGLVSCVRGSGTYVARPPRVAARPGRRREAEGLREVPSAPPDLAPVLSAELGCRVAHESPASGCAAELSGGTMGPLLLPLDERPPPDRSVVPLAPSGSVLAALRALEPGGIVHLASESPRLGCLVRNTILSLHGDGVGMARLPADAWPGKGPAPDLRLIDARERRRLGTDGPARVFLPLRLLGAEESDAG